MKPGRKRKPVARKACVTRDRSAISQLPGEGLMHKHVRWFDSNDGDDVIERELRTITTRRSRAAHQIRARSALGSAAAAFCAREVLEDGRLGVWSPFSQPSKRVPINLSKKVKRVPVNKAAEPRSDLVPLVATTSIMLRQP